MPFATQAPRRFVLTLAILLSLAAEGLSQAGSLDPTFANKGIFASKNSSATCVAIQSDGKIVFVGSGSDPKNSENAEALTRLNTDGTLDASFGSGGTAFHASFGYLTFGFFAVAIQPDGKILAAAAGSSPPVGNGLSVVRFEANGSLDTSFGTGGLSETSVIFVDARSGSLVLQPDGKILVTSGFRNPSVTARFTTSGQLDSTFGHGGIVNLVEPSPTQIAVQSNGQILVASGDQSHLFLTPTPSGNAGTITRYNANGTVDKMFGQSGTVASVASAAGLVLQSDGKIVIAGSLTSKLNTLPALNNVGFGIVRYNSNGTPDTAFGTRGVSLVDFGSNARVSGAFALALQSNGDLVAAGTTGGAAQTPSRFGLVRFTSAGKLDTTFGSGGKVITTIASGQESWLSSLAIQSDGKIVVAGTSQLIPSSITNAYIARYLAQ